MSFRVYETLKMPSDVRPAPLDDHGWPDDSYPSGDALAVADDIARAMVECAALDAMIEETNEKGRAA